MIHYREYYPSNKLRNIIACFWTISFEPKTIMHERDVVLPDGCTDLLINSGPYFTRIDLHTQEAFQVKDYALIGQRKNAIEVSPTAETTFFAIRFTPFGLRSVIPHASSELTGKMFDERVFLKRLVDPIQMILEKKNGFQEKLQQIELVLENKLEAGATINPIIKKATREILHAHGFFNVNSFCLKYGIHKSTLEKNFQSQVGLTPKEFASIVRFNYAHAQLRTGKYENFTHLALDCGYYDQSHMIKDFKRFSNSAPFKFIKAKYLLPNIAVSCYQSLRI